MADLSLADWINSDEFKRVLASIANNPEDQRQARSLGLLAAGLGMMGAPRGQEWQAIGRGGLLGVQAYRNELSDLSRQRGQNLAQAAGLYKLGKDTQFTDLGLKMLQGENGTPGVASGAPPVATTEGSSYVGMPPPPTSPAPAAAGMSGAPQWATPRTQLAFALAGKKDVSDVIDRVSKMTQGPQGTLIIGNQVVGQVLPNGAGTILDGKFYPQPPDALKAMAEQAGAMKGAEVGATEAAQQPYRTMTANVGPGGAPVTGYTNKLLGAPEVAGKPQAVPTANMAPTMSPAERQQAERDFAATGGGAPTWPNGSAGGGVMVGPNPLAVEAAKGQIAAQTAQDTKIAEGGAQDYMAAVTAERQAPQNIAKYNMLRDYFGRVETGKLAPTVQSLKAVAAYVAPDLAKEWTKDVPFAQAATALANEMALQLRNPAAGAGMPGQMSDQDRKYLQQMVASAANDPRAIPLMIDARIAVEKRNQDIGQMAREYRARRGVIDEGFYQVIADYAAKHPLFPNVAAAESAALQQPKAQELVDELRRRGVVK